MGVGPVLLLISVPFLFRMRVLLELSFIFLDSRNGVGQSES